MKNDRLNLYLTGAVAAGVMTVSFGVIAIAGSGVVAGVAIAGAGLAAGGCCFNGYRAWKPPRP
jgi:hypothetical protein